MLVCPSIEFNSSKDCSALNAGAVISRTRARAFARRPPLQDRRHARLPASIAISVYVRLSMSALSVARRAVLCLVTMLM